MSSVIYEITSASWWKAAGARALRTAVSVAIPFFMAGELLNIDWILVASTVGLAVILSVVTSLAGLKEVTGETVPRHIALGIRAIKQFAQTLVSYIGAAVLVTDVDWKAGLFLALSSTIVTILQSLVLALPEAENKFADDPVG